MIDYEVWEAVQRCRTWLQSIGVPAPDTLAWVIAIVEVGGGLALILGAWVAISAALLTIDMLVAVWSVHLLHGFSFMNITGATEACPAIAHLIARPKWRPLGAHATRRLRTGLL
jgi:uncharacterized membrane protein YphA (DoxX/SURF4 family)